MTKTKIFKLNPVSPDGKIIELAAALLRDGGLVGFPTETVYGIAANFLNREAIDRLYEIKKRPGDKPFTIHISNTDMIGKMGCETSAFVDMLVKKFWPGPLTVILPLSAGPVDRLGRQGKLGFRMPKNEIAKALISQSGVPVVAPSANISGENPPTEAGEILKTLDGKIDLVLDGGKTEFGRESTVVDTTSNPCKILREGAIAENEITKIWKELA